MQGESARPAHNEMFCSSCGSAINKAAEFCVHCGVRVQVPVWDPQRTATAGRPAVVEDDLASRGSRFVAVLVDALIILAIIITLAFFSIFLYVLIIPLMLIAGVGYWVIQMYYLGRDGQTLGKKAVGIAIVSRDTGRTPHWGRTIGLRFLLNGVIGSVVPIYGPVDILFIFRADRRCIHDMLAGTVVVRA